MLVAGMKFRAISRRDREAIMDYIEAVGQPGTWVQESPQKMEAFAWIYGRSHGNPGPAGIGVVLTNERGEVLRETSQYLGRVNDATAEFQALISALAEAKQLGVKKLAVCTDSILVRMATGPGSWGAPPKHLEPLIVMARHLSGSFETVDVVSVPSDKLSREQGLAHQAILRGSSVR